MPSGIVTYLKMVRIEFVGMSSLHYKIYNQA